MFRFLRRRGLSGPGDQAASYAGSGPTGPAPTPGEAGPYRPPQVVVTQPVNMPKVDVLPPPQQQIQYPQYPQNAQNYGISVIQRTPTVTITRSQETGPQTIQQGSAQQPYDYFGALRQAWEVSETIASPIEKTTEWGIQAGSAYLLPRGYNEVGEAAAKRISEPVAHPVSHVVSKVVSRGARAAVEYGLDDLMLAGAKALGSLSKLGNVLRIGGAVVAKAAPIVEIGEGLYTAGRAVYETKKTMDVQKEAEAQAYSSETTVAGAQGRARSGANSLRTQQALLESLSRSEREMETWIEDLSAALRSANKTAEIMQRRKERLEQDGQYLSPADTRSLWDAVNRRNDLQQKLWRARERLNALQISMRTR